MILKTGVWIVSGMLFLINLFILYKKRKSIIIEYILWHFVMTMIISSVFFPMPFQSKLIQEKAYMEKTQTLLLFRDIREIMYYTENKWSILIQYLKEYALISVSIGCAFSFSMRLSCKSMIKWFLGCLLFSTGLQLIKWLVCYVINAKYLSVTVDDVLYILFGCIIGCCFVKIIRCIYRNVECKNSIEKAIKNLLLKNYKLERNSDYEQ